MLVSYRRLEIPEIYRQETQTQITKWPFGWIELIQRLTAWLNNHSMLLLLQNHLAEPFWTPPPVSTMTEFSPKSHYVHQHEIKMNCLYNPTWALADAFPSLPPRKRSRCVGLWMDCCKDWINFFVCAGMHLWWIAIAFHVFFSNHL